MISRPNRTRVAANAIASYLRSIMALMVLFLLTPYVIHKLGAEQYGLWVLLASIIGYFELMDCGLATATVKFVGQFEGAGDSQQRNRLVSTLLATYIGIAMVVIVVATGVGAVLVDWLDVDTKHHRVAITVFAVLTAKAALNLPLALFIGVLFGRQQICLVSGIRALFCVLYGISAWATLSWGGGLIGFACAHAVLSVIEHLTLMIICLATTPGLALHWRDMDWDLLKRVVSFSAFALMTNLSTTALLRTDPILIKVFLPLWMVGVYGVAMKVAEQLLQVTKQGLNAVTPLLAQLCGARDHAGIRRVFIGSTRWSLMAMLALATPTACWAQETLTLWVGPHFAAGGPIIVLLVMAMTFRVLQESGSNVLAMTGRHRFVAVISIMNAVLNIGISLVLVRRLGATGVALGTVIATFITMVVIVTRTCIEHQVKFREYARHAIAPALRALIVQLAVCILLKRALHPTDWGALASVYAMGAGSMLAAFWIYSMSDDERTVVKQRIQDGWQRWADVPPSLPTRAQPNSHDGEVS